MYIYIYIYIIYEKKCIYYIFVHVIYMYPNLPRIFIYNICIVLLYLTHENPQKNVRILITIATWN